MAKKLSREETIKLINLYKEEECLWNPRSQLYRRGHMRDLSLEKLSKAMGMPIERIKKKIKQLRSTFLLERKKEIATNKMNKSRNDNETDLFTPYLYYYNEMTFLNEIIGIRSSTFHDNDDKSNVNLSGADNANYLNLKIEDLIACLKMKLKKTIVISTEQILSSFGSNIGDIIKKLENYVNGENYFIATKIKNEFIGEENDEISQIFSKNSDPKETLMVTNQKLFMIVEKQKNEILKLQDLIIGSIIESNCSVDNGDPLNFVVEKNEKIANELRSLIESRIAVECKCTYSCTLKKEIDIDNKHQIMEKEVLKENIFETMVIKNEPEPYEIIEPSYPLCAKEMNISHSDELMTMIKDNNVDFNSDLSSTTSSIANDEILLGGTEEESRIFASHKMLDNGTVQCTICNKILHSMSGFRRHIESHEEQGTLCPFCGIQYSSHLELSRHTPQCRKRKHENLKQAVEKKPRKKRTKGLLFKCPFESCKTQVYYEYKLIEHIAAHEGKIPYKCGCGRKFKYYQKLYIHLNYSKGKCSIENCILPENVPVFKTFEEFEKYSQRMGNYSCSYCERKFQANSKLRDHENTHTMERPYECVTCGKNYSGSASLQEHFKYSKQCSIKNAKWPSYYNPSEPRSNKIKTTIVKEINIEKRKRKDYFCYECNLKLKDHKAIRLHNERLHMEKTIACGECSMKFPTEAVYKRHVKQKHMLYKCEICQINKFVNRNAWNGHNLLYHFQNSDNLFECKKCKKLFEKNVDLIAHLKSKYHREISHKCKCLICERKYNASEYLNHLLKNDHKLLELKWRETRINKIECTSCLVPIEFENLFEYFSHLTNVHSIHNYPKSLLKLMSVCK